MKRMCLLMTMLLLTACGGGGGGGNSVTDVTPGSPTGSVVVNINNVANNVAKSVAKILAVAPPATNCRLVITNPNLRFNGVTLRVIVDGAIPVGNQITGLSFPVANGYNFELVTYIPDTVKPANTVAVKRVLQYAKTTGVSVTATGTAVTLSLQTIQANFSLPNPAISGTALGITANFPLLPNPLQSSWNLVQATFSSAVKHAVHSSATPSANHTADKSPIVLAPTTLYAQGEFHINSSLLDTVGNVTILNSTNTAATVPHVAEISTTWTFNYPNPDFGDNININNQTVVPLNTVGVPINFVVDNTLPVVTAFTLPVATQTTTTVSGIGITATDNIGVTGYFINQTGTLPASPAWFPVTSAASFSTTTASFTFPSLPAAGAHSLFVWVRDGGGNVSAAATGNVTY